MTKAGRALVVISERENRESLVQVLAACGLEPMVCSTAGEARAALESEAPDVLFCDEAFAGGSFDELPRVLGSGRLRVPVVVCAELYDPGVYLDVMNRGAFDFIVYPYRTEDVKWILATAFRRRPEPAQESKADLALAIPA
jgi:DNA-binding NtrC family response regulator